MSSVKVDEIQMLMAIRVLNLTKSSYSLLTNLIDSYKHSAESLPYYNNCNKAILMNTLNSCGMVDLKLPLPIDITFSSEVLTYTDVVTSESYNVTCETDRYLIENSEGKVLSIKRDHNAFALMIYDNIFIEESGPKTFLDKFKLKAYPLLYTNEQDIMLNTYCKTAILDEFIFNINSLVDPIAIEISHESNKLNFVLQDSRRKFKVDTAKICKFNNGFIIKLGNIFTKDKMIDKFSVPSSTNGDILLYISFKDSIGIFFTETSHFVTKEGSPSIATVISPKEKNSIQQGSDRLGDNQHLKQSFSPLFAWKIRKFNTSLVDVDKSINIINEKIL